MLRYNKDFYKDNYIYNSGCLQLDLSDVNDMKGYITSSWSSQYALKHILTALEQATGLTSGWNINVLREKIENSDMFNYMFIIKSRLYNNLRRIYKD